MRYIADNVFDDEDEGILHDMLLSSTSVLANNLMYNASRQYAEEDMQRLINSAYNVIAVCEAVASKGTTDQRVEALKKSRKNFSGQNLSAINLLAILARL